MPFRSQIEIAYLIPPRYTHTLNRHFTHPHIAEYHLPSLSGIMAASTKTLDIPLHVKYIQDLGKSSDELMYHLTSHIRLNAIYWGLTALCLMGHKDVLNREEMVDFVMSCWDDEAGTFPSSF